jgi:hypothetical protein
MTERIAVTLRWLKSTSSMLALRAAAYDDPKLVGECSTSERNGAIVRGALLIGFTSLNAALYTAVASYIAGGFSLPLGIACISASVMLGLADHQAFYRTAQYTDGLHGLTDGGMRIDFLKSLSPYSKLAKQLRIALSLLLSTTTAVGIGLILNNSAIDRRIEQEYLLANKLVVERAIRDFEQSLKRKEAAYNAKVADIDRVSASRTNDLRAAGREAYSVKRDTVIATRDAAERFEKRMATLQTQLAVSKDALDRAIATRHDFVHSAIEAAPEHLPKNTSYPRRIKALFYEEAAENPWTLLPVALVDLAIILIDLSVLTLKAIYYPSAYAAAVTRIALERLVAEARLGTSNIGARPNVADDRQKPGPSNSPTAVRTRRKRGRPRKNGFDATDAGQIQTRENADVRPI